MGSVALDASVVIGLLEPNDAHHHRAWSELTERARRRDDFLLAASAYLETLVGPLRKGQEAAVEGFVEDSGIEIVAIDATLARRAARLRADHRGVRLGDALVLATAIERQAELLTFDERLRRIAGQARS